MSGAKILVVDDDLQIRRVMRKMLAAQGYAVNEARSGEEALEMLHRGRYDLVLLDIAMPGMGGLEACRAIRAGWDLAIVILSVRDMEKDKISALDAGADDYVTKPFGTDELLAQLRALRRHSPEAFEEPMYVHGDLTIDMSARNVTVQDSEVHLTATEYALLHELVRHAGKVVLQKPLLRAVWGPDAESQLQYLRVYITHLRKKLETPDSGRLIETQPGIGYRLVAGN